MCVCVCVCVYACVLKCVCVFMRVSVYVCVLKCVCVCEVEECKKKWKYFRDNYIRERGEERIKKSGAEGGRKTRCKYMDIMSFMEPQVQERATTSNMDHDEKETEVGICWTLSYINSQIY